MKMKYLITLFLFLHFSLNTSAASFEEGREAYLAKDYEKALSILEPLAKRGHAKAQITLGIMYDFGHGVKKDPLKAVEWYEKAAAQGNSAVQHDLGVKYFKGLGIPQDYDKAAAWWRMAADNGVAESQYNLGILYARGLGVDKDYAKAVYWYSKAASQGHAHAQYSLGVMYSFGQGVPQDYSKAVSYFQDAAEKGIPQAQYNLAVLLENGRGTDVDLEGAKKWYQKAAEAGIPQAAERVAALEKASSNENSQAVTTVATADQPGPATPHRTERLEPPPTEVVTKAEPIPAPIEMEKLTIPETEIDQNQQNILPNKKPPENHTVVSGEEIEKAINKKPLKPVTEQGVTPKQSKATATTEPSPVSKEPTAEETAPDIETTANASGEYHDEDWIRAQDPGHYALQMIAFRKKERAEAFARTLDLEGDKAIYKTTMFGRPIYKVIYGNFENHKASLKGRRSLPKKYRDNKPFPRSFEFIQNEIVE